MISLAFLLFFQSLTNVFPVSRKADDSIGFPPQSLDKQCLGKGCLWLSCRWIYLSRLLLSWDANSHANQKLQKWLDIL